MANFVAPAFQAKAFTCSFCGTYAEQRWADRTGYVPAGGDYFQPLGIDRCDCVSCGQLSFWLEASEKQIHPQAVSAPMPHQYLPEACRSDYMEAREIAALSPRGAAALLRLCVQKLLVELGEKGKNINDDIANLVQKGLPIQVQQALDVCRVVGNNAVHPGELIIEDTPTLVHQLFDLINFIVEQRIEQPRRIAAMFGQLPQGAREAVSRRDGTA